MIQFIKESLKGFQKFNRKQWLTILVFAIADFCSAICVSLQAPFYPKEAEKKGATATEYGLVFGIFELTVFIVSPIIGKNLSKYGAKRVFNIGILTTGTCCILFGLLDKINNGKVFIGLSILVRIIEAIGNSGFLTASFSIIAKEFPDSVATMFACLETFFGMGLIAGPTVGGALYNIGGYPTPFAVLGLLLICAAALTHKVLPSKYDDPDGPENRENSKGMLDLLKVPSIFLAAYSIFSASITIGVIQATLEPHMRPFIKNPMIMGLVFVVNGVAYACTTTIWGYICDKKLPPIIISALGSVLINIAFLFIGPAPFFPFKPSLSLCISMLVIHGIGFAMALVAGFASAHRDAIRNGFPDNLDTYALVSGLWTATFALGAFVGPTVAGLLVDYFQFRNATLFVVASQTSVLVLTLAFIFKIYRKSKLEKEYANLDSEEDAGYYGSTRSSQSSRTVPASGNSSSSDSGSLTDYSAIDAANRINNMDQLQRSGRRLRPANHLQIEGRVRGYSHTLSGSNWPEVTGTGNIRNQLFSRSPLDPSPISLLGGYMGYSVPTTMNQLLEHSDQILPDTVVPIRSRGSQRFRAISATQDNAAIEKQPLLFKKTRETSKSNRNEVVVTAIIENHSESIRQKDSASESTIS